MFNDSDDDDFSAPSARSNLASLFNSKLSKINESSLTYSAPKQPSKRAEENTTLFCAKVVTVVGGSIDKTNNDKYGLAIIGSDSLKTYELILYKTRQNIVFRAKISASFNFSVQDYVFGAFSDKTQHWIVQFKDKKDVTEFCDQLKLFGAGITRTNTEVSRSSENSKMHINILSDKSNLVEKENTTYNADRTKNLTNEMAKIGVPVLPISSPTSNSSYFNESKKIKEVAILNDKCDGDKVPKNDEMVPAKTLNLQLNEHPQNQYVQNVHFSHSQILSVPDPLNLLAAETKLTSYETKMGLAQIQSKLDQLLNLTVQNQNISSSQDIGTIQSQNKVLQLKIENLELEIKQLRIENEKLSKNNMSSKLVETLEKENADLKTKNLNYELEITNIKKDLKLSREEGQENNLNLEQNQYLLQENMRLQNTVKELEEQVKDSNRLKVKVMELNEIIDKKEQIILQCKHELETCQPVIVDDKKNNVEKMKHLEKQIKDIMNQMYQTIVGSGGSLKSPISEEFKPVLVRHIKNSTFKIIEEIQNNFT